MAKDGRKSSRVTQRTRFEIYQRRTRKFTKTSADAQNTNFSKFNPPSIIFSPFKFPELQEFLNNKFGLTTMTSVPEYKLTAQYPPQERNNIRERHLIDGNFAVVSFGNFENRDAAFEVAKQGGWNVQIFIHRGQRRAISATAGTGLENFLKRVSISEKPTSNGNSAKTNTNTTTDTDFEMKEARSNARVNYFKRRRNTRSTENSIPNATSQLDQDLDMDNAESILPNTITTPFATTATPEAYDGDTEMSESQDSNESLEVEMEGYNSTPFTTPPTTPPVAITTPAAFITATQDEVDMNGLSAQLELWGRGDKMDVDDLSAQLQSCRI